MLPCVLTMPVMHMLRRVRSALISLGNMGAMMSGVHGAGKSHVLAMLGTILAVGAKGDIMWLPRTKAALVGQRRCWAACRCAVPCPQ